MSGSFMRVRNIVKQIPYGTVASYGQIAALSGNPRGARMVGWALHQLRESDLKKIPWHRVINKYGLVSTTCMDHPAQEQAVLLKKEGIEVKYKDGNYWVDLRKYLWKNYAVLSWNKSGPARRSSAESRRRRD